MANIQQNGNLIAKGTDCYVYIDYQDDSGAGAELLGLASEYNATKNIEVNEAQVLGEIVAVSVDAVGISANVTLSGLIPAKNQVSQYFADGKSVIGLNPSAKKIISGANGAKVPYLCLKDKKNGAIIGFGTWGVPTQFSQRSNGKGYLNVSVTIKFVDYQNGSDYEYNL